MKHIFYFIGIFFVLYELYWIINPVAMVRNNKRFIELGKIEKDLKWDKNSDEYKTLYISTGLTSFVFLLYFFIGLLSFNWVAFALILAFNIVIIMPISRLTRYSFAYTALHWINSVIGLVFGVFVIVNSYHLKIDLYALLLNYLK